MRKILILNTFYDAGHAKYLAGQQYPVDEDTLRQVAKGNGQEIDVPEEAPAPPPAAKTPADPPAAEPASPASPPAAPPPATAARKRAAS